MVWILRHWPHLPWSQAHVAVMGVARGSLSRLIFNMSMGDVSRNSHVAGDGNCIVILENKMDRQLQKWM